MGDQTGGVTLTFAPDIKVPPRVPGDHIATLQKGHTQHILRFLVFLGWRRNGRGQKVAEAGSFPELTTPPTQVRGPEDPFHAFGCEAQRGASHLQPASMDGSVA